MFMQFIASLAALVILAVLPQPSFGQAEVRVSEFASCPSEAVLRSFPGVTQPSVGVGATLTKFSATPLYLGEDAKLVTKLSLPFGTQLTVYGFSRDQRSLFVRTIPAVGNSPLCGWISAERVIIPRGGKFEGRYKRPQPLQMRDISKAQEANQNLLNVKAVVHDLSITGDVNGGIDVFEAPQTGRPIDKIKLFDAFLVFDKMELANAAPAEESRYWLIGEQASNGETTLLKGWIRQRDVVIWPSRLAVQWNETVTVSGYVSEDNLNKKLSPLTIPERVERADYPEQITRRLPVLEQSPEPALVTTAVPVGGSLEERSRTARNLIRFYRIATPGKACRKDNPADCLSARQIDNQREKIITAEKAAMKIDVVILMDATESMDPYFESTVRTLETLLKQTETDQVRDKYDLRFAISLYGDYNGNDASIDQLNYNEVVQFFRPTPGPLGTQSSMRRLLQDPKSLVFNDIHRDRLEAPFAAVIRAASKSRWRPLHEVPLRFIVHLGDAGNRDLNKTAGETQARYPSFDAGFSPPQSTLRENVREEDVVDALRKANVIYIPVVIANGTLQKPAYTLANQIYKDQTSKILNLLGTDAPIKKTLETFTLQPRESLVVTTAKAVVDVLQSVDKAVAYQRCSPTSRSESCDALKKAQIDITSPEIVKLVDRVASAAAGLTSEVINNIYSRDQSIVTMYVPAQSNEGREMFTHWVALEQREFELLSDLLRTLCENMSTQDSRNPVMKSLREFSEMYSNEDFTDLTVGEILGKRLGIPNLERTDFSGRTRDEIEDAYRAWQTKADPRTWNNWHLRACKASAFIGYMRDGRKVDPKKISCNLANNLCEVENEKDRSSKFRWSVQVSRASPTYYVPLDILP